MNDKLYLMIVGEHGKRINVPFSRKKSIIALSISLAVVALFSACSIFSIGYFFKNRNIISTYAELKEKVELSDKLIARYQLEVENNKTALDQEVESLRAAHEEEKEVLISTVVNELSEKNQIFESILETIGSGKAVKKISGESNSGGPFIPVEEGSHDDLLNKAEKYLETIRQIPLGKPVSGKVTSKFGRRSDPLNKKKSFHEGVDFRGKRGEEIHATADGVVKRAFINGGYGKYVEIDHKNGYTTAFAHLQDYSVKKGDKVERGQVIARVGNTGRSTGPHLHYEIMYKKKPVNPEKYMQVAELLKKKHSKTEK